MLFPYDKPPPPGPEGKPPALPPPPTQTTETEVTPNGTVKVCDPADVKACCPDLFRPADASSASGKNPIILP
jgi:hypothetical protein